MNAAELRARVARGADLHTEFKLWPVGPGELAEVLVAFANTDGGQLFLGIADDRRIAGVDDPDTVTRGVDDAALNNCDPPVTVVQEVLLPEEADGAAVVVVNVPKGTMRPYKTQRGDHFYVKTSSGRRRASREELLRLFQAGSGIRRIVRLVRQATGRDIELQAGPEHFEVVLTIPRPASSGTNGPSGEYGQT